MVRAVSLDLQAYLFLRQALLRLQAAYVCRRTRPSAIVGPCLLDANGPAEIDG